MNSNTATAHEAISQIDLPGVPLFARGKVRDIYDFGDRLLLVTSDRLSAYDVVLPTPIPGKGQLLNQVSRFWFEKTQHLVPNHLITTDIAQFPDPCSEFADRLNGRSMLVKRCERIDFECVVRGYITGSLMKEYKEARFATAGDDVPLHGFRFPRDLIESQKLPEPIFTPATKNDTGHDENVSFAYMAERVGDQLAAQLRDLSFALYTWCAEYAATHGIIIADTKFEFGHDGDTLTLIDEICTPDSSRFWDAKSYRPGQVQDSLDKQYVRNYLTEIGWDKKPPGPELPAEVVRKTISKYQEVQERLHIDNPDNG